MVELSPWAQEIEQVQQTRDIVLLSGFTYPNIGNQANLSQESTTTAADESTACVCIMKITVQQFTIKSFSQ